MCGIFAYATKTNQGPHLPTLERIAKETERRGPHAFGLAWIDGRGRLKMFKQTGRISQSLDVLAMVHDARLLVGHCRYATQGTPDNNLNNHPHSVDGGWLVHNGVIGNYRELVEDHALRPVTECDSEVLSLLIEEGDGSLTERCIRAAQLADGGPLALLALWRSPNKLVAVRRGNPICMGENQRGFYLASLMAGLPAGAHALRDNVALTFSLTRGRATLRALDAAEVLS